MKRIILFFALPFLVFTSCEKESPVEKQNIASDVSSEGLAFSVSSANSRSSEVKSGLGNGSKDFYLGGVTLSLTESSSTSDDTYLTKGAPVEDSETFRDSIEYMKVWGWNNSIALSKISSPQLLKKRGLKYLPVDASDKYKTIIVSDVVWKNPRFYALAPAEPTGTVGSITASNSTFRFKYTFPAPDPAKNCDAQAQHDLLTGVFTGDESNLTNNIAPLTFDHPLAAFKFKLGTVAEDFTLHSISIADVNSTATCSVNAVTGAITWSNCGTLKTYVQNFEESYTTESPAGTLINDSELTKTFYVIPTTYSYTSDARIEISYYRDGEEMVGSLPLREIALSPGTTYTFTVSALPGPWVDFSNTDKAGGKGVSEISYTINDYISFNYPQVSGSYEKFYIPIKGLKVGQWYKMDFGEFLKSSSGTYWNGADGAGIYACKVDQTAPTSSSRGSMITYYGGSDADAYDKYIWMGYEGSSQYTSLRQEHNELTFRATAKNMYWVWDTSKCDDAASNMYFTFTNFGFTKLSAPTVPAVDYLNSDFYGFCHSFTDDRSNGYSTFKVNSGYGTDIEEGYMEFHMRPYDKYTKLNIPLINLSAGHRYRLSFKYKFTVRSLRDSRAFGFSVAETKNTTTDSATDHSSDDFQYRTNYVTNKTEYSVTYDFEATTGTMYWIWDMARLSESGRNIIFFYDTTIEDITSSIE